MWPCIALSIAIASGYHTYSLVCVGVSYGSTIYLGVSCGMSGRVLAFWAAKELYMSTFGKRGAGVPMPSTAASSSSAAAPMLPRWTGQEMLDHDAYLRGILVARPRISKRQLQAAIQRDHICVCSAWLVERWLSDVRQTDLTFEQMREWE